MADTTLHKILDKLQELLEGTAGDTRTIPAAKFDVVSEDEQCLVSMCTAEPRPAYIIDAGSETPADLPGDQAGDYHYCARRIQVYIAYGYDPAAASPLTRPTVIADDDEAIRACLEFDLNCALVDGWCSADATSRIIITRDEATGLPVVKWLVVDLVVSYREDRS